MRNFFRTVNEAIEFQRDCNVMILKTANCLGIDPNDYESAFDKWIGSQPGTYYDGLEFCQKLALAGLTMPWEATMRQPGKTQKLTDEQVAELRRLGATKQYSYDQLGKRFGVSLSYVGRLLKRGNKR